ncbi:MAG: ISL3 family transposase [Methanobrevibacter sp.]|jgi:transposase|nr:ISL3 family transposase [Candidatus Methanoflexus mossambicus]
MQNIDNEKIKIFELALGITEPWYITETKFDGNELHINVAFKRGSKFKNKEGNLVTAYDTVERTWRHLNFFQYRAYIHARVPRIKSEKGINNLEVPWARGYTGFTILFEKLVLALAKRGVSIASKMTGLDSRTVFRIIKNEVLIARDKVDLSTVEIIGMDEKAYSGREFITILADHNGGRVIGVIVGKNTKAVNKLIKEAKDKGLKPKNITTATSDFATTFRNCIAKKFKKAIHIADRFHAVGLVNKTMNLIRNDDVKSGEMNKGLKYVLLKNEENLTDNQRIKLAKIKENECAKTVLFYKQKELFNSIYNNYDDIESATIIFEDWLKNVSEIDSKHSRKLVKTFTKNKDIILNYFKNKKTNALLESINSRIQAIITRGRGYRNIDNLITMIFFELGDLDIDTSFAF